MSAAYPARAIAHRLAHPPDLLGIHSRWPTRWPYLLASSAHGDHLGRWSLLLRRSGARLVLAPGGGLSGPGEGSGFLDRLTQLTAQLTANQGVSTEFGSTLPFVGGWFLYLGYELASEIEPRLNLPQAADGLPVALADRCPAALLHDHFNQTSWLLGESEQQLDQARREIDASGQLDNGALPEADLRIQADPDEDFLAGVDRIHQWIVAGDVFQVNLSRAWQAHCRRGIDAVALFRALAGTNPAPFAGLARLPGGTVLSSSPERLVRIQGDCVQTRPIAGTRPRGRSADDDANLSAELFGHPKERAEHIMLIDLERNDLGRVCRPGSVEVDELMVIESYAHVHHIVSNVCGTLRERTHPADVIRAVFPGGTITGCPKVRCMEIIAELERVGRGFYTGAMGYLSNDGNMDLNILIRSMCVRDQQLTFRTGAGIVIDSDPRAELAETEAKAEGLLRALNAGGE